MPHNLLEELFLLSINDEKGTVVSQAASTLRYGLAGAMLADLALTGRIGLADGKRVVVIDPTPTGDDLLDEMLQVIHTADRSKKISYWINGLSSSPRKLIKRVAGRLVAQGILREEEKCYLWVIPYAAYPQADASAKYWIKQRLRDTVLAGRPVEARTVALLSLVKAIGLTEYVFTREERKAAQKRIDALVKGDAIGDAVSEVLAAIEAATTTAILAAVS